MKIAYVVDRFPSISETFVLAQITGMIDKGHDVQVFARRGKQAAIAHPMFERYRLREITTYTGAPPVSLLARIQSAASILAAARRKGQLSKATRALNPFRFGRSALSLRLLIGAAPYFDHEHFDIVHCQFGDLATDLWKLRRCGALTGVLVTSFRGTDAMKIATRHPERFAALFSDGEKFLAVSEAVRKKLILAGCPADKIEVLRSGINLDRFEYRGFQPVREPLRVISVGRLAPNKGLEFCIRAIKKLVDRGVSVTYRIVGAGPLRESLEALVADLGLTETVTFEGAKTSDQVIDVLRQSDVLVTPSITGPDGEQEGLPNAPKEAMAIGVPVIATRIGGVPELIEDRATGFLVDERDVDAIVQCLDYVSDAGQALLPIVESALTVVHQHFDIQKLNDKLEITYNGLVELAA